MEENLHLHAAWVQQQAPGMCAVDLGGVLVVDSGLDTDTFNKICRARLREDNADRAIEAALDHFRAARRRYAWWLGPLSRPRDLAARLEARGHHRAESELGMAAECSRLPARDETPPGLEIRRVRTLEELRDFAAVNASNCDPPGADVTRFFELAAPLLPHDDCPMRLFTGYFEGAAAATSECFLGGGVAGVHMVSTRREFQRRGIGMAMTWRACGEGRAAGLAAVTLQASDQGRPVYERLGFEALCEFTEYRLRE